MSVSARFRIRVCIILAATFCSLCIALPKGRCQMMSISQGACPILEKPMYWSISTAGKKSAIGEPIEDYSSLLASFNQVSWVVVFHELLKQSNDGQLIPPIVAHAVLTRLLEPPNTSSPWWRVCERMRRGLGLRVSLTITSYAQ